jgi:branched-chain amino acid transport system permease protein
MFTNLRYRFVRLKSTLVISLIILAIGFFIPYLTNTYVVGSVVFLFAVYSILAISYDILGGLAGYMNLGHAVFFGIGAYAAAILFKKVGLPIVLSVALSPVIVGAFAFLFSFPLFRLKGFYFSVAGLAFLELANLVVASMNAKPITNGFDGITFVQYDILTPYRISILILTFSLIVFSLVSISKLGVALRCIKQDEDVSSSAGIDITSAKRSGLIIGALLAGLDGAVYFWGRGAISPNAAFGFSIAFVPVTVALLGGSGTLVGPIVGSLVYVYLQNYGISYLQSSIPELLYFPNAITGVILILVGLFLSGGITGSYIVRKIYLKVTESFKS